MRLPVPVSALALLVATIAIPAARADRATAAPDESLFRCHKPKGKLRIEFKADLDRYLNRATLDFLLRQREVE